MEEGILLKRYGGFFFVLSADGVFECTYRGKYRRQKEDIYPGDRVFFSRLPGEKKAVIEKVLERGNLLPRPPVANASQLVCVVAVKSPEPNLYLLDKLLVVGEAYGLKTAICVNKVDLAAGEDLAALLAVYGRLDYPLVVTSVKTGKGIGELRSLLKDDISVFAGQSGVGKSSLINKVKPGENLKVGEVSEKIQRGRHTTRHVELLRLPTGGLVVDTPGFNVIDLPNLRREELGQYFPEIRERQDSCRFNTCLHDREPDCAIKRAVQPGQIHPGRYRNYLSLLGEVISRERSF